MCYLYFFCLHCCLINIHIFDYRDSRLSGLFTEVPTNPDDRGATVVGITRTKWLWGQTNRNLTSGLTTTWSNNIIFVRSTPLAAVLQFSITYSLTWKCSLVKLSIIK